MDLSLTAELVAIRELVRRTPEHDPEHFATAAAYAARYADTHEGHEVARCFPPTDHPLHVLDIGAGRGHAAVMLCLAGHRVTALEPSPEFCDMMLRAARRWSLPMSVVEGTAETIDPTLDPCDVVLFNASLHHLDDPAGALTRLRAVLAPGGRVVAANEPVLKPYQSRAAYFRALADDPAMGHYGGNEHVYRVPEYLALFRAAGFRRARVERPALVCDARLRDRLSVRKRHYFALLAALPDGMARLVAHASLAPVTLHAQP